MKNQHVTNGGRRLREHWSWRLGAVLSVTSLSLAGLVSTEVPSSASTKPTVTVWVDATRIPAVKAYEKANPNVNVKMVIYAGEDPALSSKISLLNRTGSGWPDVVFSEAFNDIATLSDANFHYPAQLDNGLVPNSTLKQFATGSNSVCTVNGHLYCLRNDIGQDVLWYNAKLLKQFGYPVPTTWQQYEALGAQVAAQHPGYIVGDAGDVADDAIYLQANKCPVNEYVNPTTVDINPGSPSCTRIVNLMDTMIKNKSMSTVGVFTPTFDTQYAGKVLMLIGPSWFGQYLFGSKTGLNVPAGEVGAADPLTWQGATTATTGDWGGGVWIVSSHSKDPKAAAALATWVATNPAYQASAPTFPAYVPAAVKWIAAVNKSGYFQNNVAPVFAAAAGEIWTKWDNARFPSDLTWGSTVLPALTSGQSIKSAFPTFASTLANLAKADGYTVVTKP